MNLDNSGIDLHSGHVFHVAISYDGSRLEVTLTDTITNASATQSYAIDLIGVLGSSKAYAGFTGGSSSQTAVQDIRNWIYDPLG